MHFIISYFTSLSLVTTDLCTSCPRNVTTGCCVDFFSFHCPSQSKQNYGVATKLNSMLSHLVTVGILSNGSSCRVLGINREVTTLCRTKLEQIKMQLSFSGYLFEGVDDHKP